MSTQDFGIKGTFVSRQSIKLWNNCKSWNKEAINNVHPHNLPLNGTWEITCKFQNQSFVSNACLPSSISNITNPQKTVRLALVFKTHNCHPFQSFSSFDHPFFLFYLLCYNRPSFNVLSSYFYFCLHRLVAVPSIWILKNFAQKCNMNTVWCKNHS